MENPATDNLEPRPKFRIEEFHKYQARGTPPEQSSYSGASPATVSKPPSTERISPENPQTASYSGPLPATVSQTSIYQSNFRNSPGRMEEFHKYFKAVTSDSTRDDGDALNDFCDWDMSPFLGKYPLLWIHRESSVSS